MTHARQAKAPPPLPRELTPHFRNPTSPATWFGLLGAAALLGTFYLVFAGARRTARAEARGEELAQLLLEIGNRVAPIEWDARWQGEHVLSLLLATAAARGVFVGDVELDESHGPFELRCKNKHYCIALRPSPRPLAGQAPTIDGSEPLEAMAWPLDAVGPAHAVFFWPADAEAAYSRNLQSGYVDTPAARRPPPGCAHRRTDARRAWNYRGIDDERWLLLDRGRS